MTRQHVQRRKQAERYVRYLEALDFYTNPLLRAYWEADELVDIGVTPGVIVPWSVIYRLQGDHRGMRRRSWRSSVWPPSMVRDAATG